MTYLIFIVFVAVCFRLIAPYVHLWYVKEYRFDRMMIHLRTPQGKSVLIPPYKLPPLSPKTALLSLLLFCYASLIYFFAPFGIWGNSVLVLGTLYGISWFFVWLLSVPTRIYHAYVISKAVKKLRHHAPMIVIGITGSYGKTSTKEFLATILSSRYKVLKTEASKNSPIGIAETIHKSLRDDHEVFIVEMGAYRPGEIAKMCSMVHPTIGIVTAINPQHQDLFLSLETTKKAKFELFEGLIGERVAIGNTDNPHVVDMLARAKKIGCKTCGVGVMQNKTYDVDEFFSIGAVLSTPTTLSFSVAAPSGTLQIKTKIRGEHFCVNVGCAIAASLAAGMEMSAITKASETLTNYDRSMEMVDGPSGSILINDTFNNNPDAAIASLAYARKFPGKLYLVFQPMIELGSYTDASHYDVGKFAGSLAAAIYVTNKNFYESFARGIAESGKKPPELFSLAPHEAAVSLVKRLQAGDVVLFKGKEAAFVLSELQKMGKVSK